MRFPALLVMTATTHLLAPYSLAQVLRIAAGESHAVAFRSDGLVWAWGDNSAGALGQGATSGPIATAVPIQGFRGVAALAAGSRNNLTVQTDGTAWTWGRTPFATTNIATPTPIPSLFGIVQVAAGRSNHLALGCDGTLWVWGSNQYGQLGQGVYVPNGTATPAPVPGITMVTAMASGDNHILALRNDGTVWAWGRNFSGQLGLGTLSTVSPFGIATPTPVPGVHNITAIAAGSDHSLALRSDGTVLAWGNNSIGQLGQGFFTPGSPFTPIGIPFAVVVPGLTNIVAIAAGSTHSMALRSDGTTWAWGSNAFGALGQGYVTTTSPPGIPFAVPVSGLSRVVALAAGSNYGLALDDAGEVYAWGINSAGQLGQGVVTSYPVPVPLRVPLPILPPQTTARVSVKRITSGGRSSWDPSRVADWLQGASMILSQGGLRLSVEPLIDLPDPGGWFSAPINSSTKDQLESAAELNPCLYAWRQDAINIYLTDGLGTGICSLPTYPVMRNDLILLGPDLIPNYSEMMPVAVAHELGHYLGLRHTFESTIGENPGSCTVPALNCNIAGDHVCDTPRDIPPPPMSFQDPGLLPYPPCSCEYSRLRWNVMSYYPNITASSALLTPGQVERIESFLPYRTNVMSGGSALTRGCAFSNGLQAALTLQAPSAPNSAYFTAPALSAPLSLGTGLPTDDGGELLLSLADPLLQAVLGSLLAPIVVGAFGTTDANGIAITTVNLPSAPELVGLVLYWQSATIGPLGFTASQVLPVTIQ